MKKLLGLITIISCAFVLALSFTSCSSDDGPKISKNSYYVGLYVTSGKPHSSIASGDDGRAYLASVDAKLLAISKQFGAEHVTQAEAKKNYQNMVLQCRNLLLLWLPNPLHTLQNSTIIISQAMDLRE